MGVGDGGGQAAGQGITQPGDATGRCVPLRCGQSECGGQADGADDILRAAASFAFLAAPVLMGRR